MFLIALALFATNQPDRWVHLGGAAGLHEDYLDKESLKRSGDKAMVWTRRDARGARSTLWHEIEFDCSAKTETILAYIRDDAGTVSHNTVRPHRGAVPIPPKSIEEKAFEIACR